MTTSPLLRIGDAERDAAAGRLGQHFAAGRLDEAEYQDRLAAALAARTEADLAHLFADLPALTPPRSARLSGMRTRLLLPGLGLGLLLLLALGALAHGGSSSVAAAAPVGLGRGRVAAFPGPLPAHDVWTVDPRPIALLVVVACLVGLWAMRRRARPHH